MYYRVRDFCNFSSEKLIRKEGSVWSNFAIIDIKQGCFSVLSSTLNDRLNKKWQTRNVEWRMNPFVERKMHILMLQWLEAIEGRR